MSDNESLFDDLSGLSPVKAFSQSQPKGMTVLDLPAFVQEFEKVESEFDSASTKTSELTDFATDLTSRGVVRREDIVTLESIIDGLDRLPHINSYTEDLSYVNYEITQEAITDVLKDLSKKTIDIIKKYIAKTIEFITNMLKTWWENGDITGGTKFREKAKQAKEDIMKREAKVNAGLGYSPPGNSNTNSNTATVSADDLEERRLKNIKLNKELKKHLYPAYNNLDSLKKPSNVSMSVLIDEMALYRIKNFYTPLIDAFYQKDDKLARLCKLYAAEIINQYPVLLERTKELYTKDLTVAPTEHYQKVFTQVPLQVTDFIDANQNSANIFRKPKSPDEEYHIDAMRARSILDTMTDITLVKPVPTPRVLMEIDLDWIDTLVGDVDAKSIKNIAKYFKLVKDKNKLVMKTKGNYHPDYDKIFKDLYSDWMTINNIAVTFRKIASKVDSLVKNISHLYKDVDKVIKVYENL